MAFKRIIGFSMGFPDGLKLAEGIPNKVLVPELLFWS